MTPSEKQPPFAMGEERTIDGVSYTCVLMPRGGRDWQTHYDDLCGAIGRIDGRKTRNDNVAGGCTRCFIYAPGVAVHRECNQPCQCGRYSQDGQRRIVHTADLPILALEGLL